MKLKQKVQIAAKQFGCTKEEEINLIVKAIQQKNDELIEDIFTKKKWKQFQSKLESIKETPSLNKANQILHFRFPIKPINPKKGSPIKVIIMGPCGSGKTTAVNHLCGSDLQTGDTARSLTRNITEIKCQYDYPNPLVLYDTPGTTAHVDKLEHATHLRTLLQFAPVNCVCILVKYDGRFDQLVNNIYRQLLMLQEFAKNVVFLISHFDLSKDVQLAKDSINKFMQELKLNNQIVYFSNEGLDQKKFCDSIYAICSEMPRVQIKIDEKTFFKYFNLKKQETQKLYMKAGEQQTIKDMENLTQVYVNFASCLPDNDQRDAILQDIQAALKNQLTQIFDNFCDKYKNTMELTQYYQSYYTLQLKIKQFLEKYIEKISKFQKHKFIESQATGSQLDIRDLIKKCPNPKCNLIWFRIQSCPNTCCGQRPSCVFDFIKKYNPFRYRIVRDKKTNKIKYQKTEHYKKAVQISEQKIVGNDTIKNRVNRNKLGCGQTMNFQSLPRLPDIQTILMQWYNVHTMEEVISRFQAQEQLEKKRKQLEYKMNNQYRNSFKY